MRAVARQCKGAGVFLVGAGQSPTEINGIHDEQPLTNLTLPLRSRSNIRTGSADLQSQRTNFGAYGHKTSVFHLPLLSRAKQNFQRRNQRPQCPAPSDHGFAGAIARASEPQREPQWSRGR